MKNFAYFKKTQIFIFAFGFFIQSSFASHHCEETMEKAVNKLSGTFENIVNQADICSEIFIVAEELAQKPNPNAPFIMKTGPGTPLNEQFQEQQQNHREIKKIVYTTEFMMRGLEAEKERISKNLSPNDKKIVDDFLNSYKK